MRKQTTDESSAKPLLLDTHVAVWLREGSQRLKPRILSLIEDSFHRGSLCISPISAWEIGLLAAKGRLDLSQDPLLWFDRFLEKFSVGVMEITPEIAIASSYLPGKLHGDPADRIIVSTAIINRTHILTADEGMVSYGKQGFVPVIQIQ